MGKMLHGGIDSLRVRAPDVFGKQSTGEGNGVKIGWGCVVPKCASSVKDCKAANEAGMQGDQVWVVLGPTKGSTDIIIPKVYFQVRVGGTWIVKPDHEQKFSPSKGEGRFSLLAYPIIDSHAPRFRAEATIENRARVLE